MSQECGLAPTEGAKETQKPDRRRAVRCQCTLNTSWRSFGPGSEDCWLGTIQDISIKGIRLVIDKGISQVAGSAPKVGAFLDISLQDPADRKFSQPVLVRVRRVTERSDGSSIVGCTFVKRLGKEELQALLDRVTATTA